MFLWLALTIAALPPPQSPSIYDLSDKFAPWTCLECAHENHYDDDYCRVCEAPNPDPLRVDPYTGHKIEEDAEF